MMKQELALARKKYQKNKAYIKQLKKIKKGKLDKQIHELHQQEFKSIDCLTCANCCKTTGPLLTDTDINRISKYLKMKPANFTAEYLKIDEDKDFIFNTLPCPFLGTDNYCLIYEARPKACREYPHTNRKNMHQILNLTLKNTVVCPAVFRIFEKLKDIRPD